MGFFQNHKGLTTIVYKGLMKSHSKYRDMLSNEPVLEANEAHASAN